jgi:SP family arabinose:H+ symporter-like MFS transporter
MRNEKHVVARCEPPLRLAASKGNYRYLLPIASTAALGGFLFGYDTAVVSGAIGFLRGHFQLSADLTGWAASSLLVGCMAGAAVAGPLGDRFGRKWTLVGCAVLFFVSSVFSAMPNTIDLFAWSRFAGGIAIGAASMLCPLYIAEISPERTRGTLVTLYQLAIVVGILVVFFVNRQIQRLGDEAWNTHTGWRWMFASLAFPSLLFGGLMMLVPESPRWLMKTGRRDLAFAILQKVGGETSASREIQAIEEALRQEEGRWSELLTSGYRRALTIGVLLAILCQLSGINAIIYYAPSIFQSVGFGTDAAFTQTVIVGAVNLAFTLAAIWLIDRLGRRPLLIVGTVLQVISELMIGWMFLRGEHGPLLLISIVMFTGSFALAMAPIPWVIIAEIFPTKLRGRAMSLAIMMLWLADFAVTQTFPRLQETIGPAHTFWLYAFFSLVSVVFVVGMVPETKGRTLEEIEALWRSKSA